MNFLKYLSQTVCKYVRKLGEVVPLCKEYLALTIFKVAELAFYQFSVKLGSTKLRLSNDLSQVAACDDQVYTVNYDNRQSRTQTNLLPLFEY